MKNLEDERKKEMEKKHPNLDSDSQSSEGILKTTKRKQKLIYFFKQQQLNFKVP